MILKIENEKKYFSEFQHMVYGLLLIRKFYLAYHYITVTAGKSNFLQLAIFLNFLSS
jgi:hypothetical protein